MFGFSWPELLGAGALVAAVIIGTRWGTRSQWQSADDRWRVAVPPAELEPPLARLLAALPAARVNESSAGTWTLTVTRAPWWTFVAVVLLFRIGLLFLLVRERADVQVLSTAVAGGTEVRLLGTTRASVRNTVAEALAAVPHRST
jgi:hypothetical protein